MSTPGAEAAGAAGWRVERHRGPASRLHHLDDPPAPGRVVRVLEVDRAALVLGSTQRAPALVDARAVEAAGVEVVRRRSGGGAVLLVPGDHVWVDLLVDRADPLWDDDVVRAAGWVGEVWAAAAGALGAPDPEVHRGGVVAARWSAEVCFAGVGPGEVLVGGRKLVGVSQRRSRDRVRAQTMVHRRWDPEATVALLALADRSRREATVALSGAVATLPAGGDEVLDAVLGALAAVTAPG